MALVTYPFTLPTLNRSIDRNAMKGIDFNRMILQINAIEATLGPSPGGSTASIARRLIDVSAANDGMQKGGVICEADPSSPTSTQGQRATRRWFYDKTWSAQVLSVGEYVHSYPYNIFDAGTPPTVFTLYFSSTDIDTTLYQRAFGVIQAQSPYLWRYKAYQADGNAKSGPYSQSGAFLALGTLEVFEDLAPYMWRVDDFGTPPGV